MLHVEESKWPLHPYKGLSAYGPEDAPLFAGRAEDVELFADALASRSTRIMILHGVTGCGKTSFLRAGLIPYLERAPLRFEFIKDRTESKYKALFIRSTANPLIMTAQAVYQFAAEDIRINTFLGMETVKLSHAVAEFRDITDFLKTVSDEPRVLVQTLSTLAGKMPKTLVLIVDQAEELLTLNQTPEGQLFRKRFFEFVSLFSQTQFDLKLMFAFRTEFYGRFISEYGTSLIQPQSTQQYLLEELNNAQLLEAITRPTSHDEIPGYGKPFDHYRFSFEPGLPETIAEDLKSTLTPQAKLSLMQLTCWNLYQQTEQGSADGRVIKFGDYNYLGRPEVQLERRIDEALTHLWRQQKSLWRFLRSSRNEVGRWKDVLTSLLKEQGDRIITTDIVSRDKLFQTARRAGCSMPFDRVTEYLSRDEIRILRPVSTVDFGNGDTTPAYSLGHDAVGHALKFWTEKSHQEKAETSRWRFISIVGGFLLLAAAGSLYLMYPQRIGWFGPVVIAGIVVVFGNVRTFRSFLLSVAITAYREFVALLSSLVQKREKDKEREWKREQSLHNIFSEPKRTQIWFSAIAFFLFFLVGLFGLFQTRASDTLLRGPSRQEILEHMRESEARQRQIRESYNGPISTGIQVELFSAQTSSRIRNVIEVMLSDRELQGQLEINFGRSFEDVQAVIVPSWMIGTQEAGIWAGLTDYGWDMSQGRFPGGSSPAWAIDSVSGYTIRDRPDELRATVDGRPRIVLNSAAFMSDDALKLALLHEMFHAMNVPGNNPPWYMFTRDDLAYLDVYREYERREGLRRYSDAVVWPLAVILPFLTALVSLRRLFSLWRQGRTRSAL